MSIPAPRDFVRVLAPALRQAAAIARALEGRVQNRPKSGEVSRAKAALTIADTAAQEALLVPMLEKFPGVRLEAEEDTPSVHRFPLEGDACVVIDPIDGTLHSYLEGEGPYAVMIGLAVKGRYEAALVALPREGLFFDAVRGTGARMARGADRPEPAVLARGGRRILVSHWLPSQIAEPLERAGYELVPASGGAISVAPLLPGCCAGLRLARARVDRISTRGRIGVLIATEAGAYVRREGGAAFPTQIAGPARALLTASTPEALSAIEAAVGTAARGAPPYMS